MSRSTYIDQVGQVDEIDDGKSKTPIQQADKHRQYIQDQDQ
jgi:hypothetical protein